MGDGAPRTEKRPTTTTRLFVYGTLMRGESNHGHLAGATFAGAARTRAEFTLVSLGAFPGIRAGGAVSIAGEVYDIDDRTLRHLDEFEGHPHFYRRSEIVLDDGACAHAYVLRARHVGETEIVSGRWPRT
jgi:gamma-glutamylaminecyclotransferase